MGAPKAAEFVLQALKQEGVGHVFTVPGGLIDDFLPAFGAATSVTAIVAASETGAGFMADGYARASGRFGACLALGGPGAANLVPALSSAYSDGSPILALAGEVPSDWELRGAFQDGSAADLEIMRPITVFAREVPVVSSLPHDLHVAVRTMAGNVQRPVFLSLPQQIQSQPVAEPYHPVKHWLDEPPRVLDRASAENARSLLTSGAKLAILAGNGAMRSGATDVLTELADTFHIPVASTLRAKSVFQEDHGYALDVFGYAGTRRATLAITPQDDPSTDPNKEKLRADVLLILGSALNQRDTLYRSSPGLPKVTVQVDIDPTAFNRHYPVSATVMGDVREFLRWMLDDPAVSQALAKSRPARDSWISDLQNFAPFWYDFDNIKSDAVPIHPARVVYDLNNVVPVDCMLVVDSGAHRAFAGHYWQCHAAGPKRYFTATTMAPMGWAIAAAAGIKVALPDRPCVVLTGDGCMLMQGMEIQTAVRYGLKIVYVVINNSALGNVYLRAKQQGPSAAALAELPTHDWVQFARGLGADGERVLKPGDLAAAFDRALKSSKPYVVDVVCDKNFVTPVYPWQNAKQLSFE
ncbi:MAG: thiamine pyrophosphate-binding protein [Xanthobacteraceae bacterium]|nr:thiamine pyrophosphate-binding protein [Xanthobacteraceae bacterium]